MRLRSRGIVLCTAIGTGLFGSVVAFSTATSAHAAAAPVVIGVDHAPPGGHNFEYVDFFPRSGISVHTGDVVAFTWGASPDGLHTATLLKNGESPQAAWQSTPAAVPDGDDGTHALQFNPAIGAPTKPPPGSGAPGACGNAASPCSYDGSTTLNSGVHPTDGSSSFVAKINAPAGTTLNFVCLVHPGMVGSLKVVATATPATSSASAETAASAQAAQDTTGALGAETAASTASSAVGPSGHRTFTATVGTATPTVEVAEFLPGTLSVGVGDSVNWVTHTIKDIHTVTFPSGTHAADALASVCEGAGAVDPALAGPPTSCPGGPMNFETHFIPAPFGTNSISSSSQVASSGLLANPPAPFPTKVTYTFPTAGTFSLFCHIHENGMKGSVVVQAASTVAVPVTGQPHFTG